MGCKWDMLDGNLAMWAYLKGSLHMGEQNQKMEIPDDMV